MKNIQVDSSQAQSPEQRNLQEIGAWQAQERITTISMTEQQKKHNDIKTDKSNSRML